MLISMLVLQKKREIKFIQKNSLNLLDRDE